MPKRLANFMLNIAANPIFCNKTRGYTIYCRQDSSAIVSHIDNNPVTRRKRSKYLIQITLSHT